MFPLPIITGIGHATNETVAEMVAYKNAITPTELADYLLQKFHNFSVPVQRAEQVLQDRIPRILTDNRARFQDRAKYLRSLTANMLSRSDGQLSASSRSLLHHTRFLVSRERGQYLSMVRTLRRGVISLCASAYQSFERFALAMKKDTGNLQRVNRQAVFQPENLLSAVVR